MTSLERQRCESFLAREDSGFADWEEMRIARFLNLPLTENVSLRCRSALEGANSIAYRGLHRGRSRRGLIGSEDCAPSKRTLQVTILPETFAPPARLREAQARFDASDSVVYVAVSVRQLNCVSAADPRCHFLLSGYDCAVAAAAEVRADF